MPKKQAQKTFWMKLHQNRLKVVTITFLVIAPILLVLALYIGSYIGGGRVYFEDTQTDSTEVINDFVGLDGIKHFELFIDWMELKLPSENTEGDLDGGYYRFSVSYVLNGTYNVSEVTMTPVLQVPWSNIRYLGPQTSISNVPRLMTIPYNTVMPVSPMLFINVEDPVLYMKVTYLLTSVGGTDIENTEYVMFSLDGLNPGNVLD
jgi:hypothetical protein